MRLLALIYEALLLAALLWCSGLVLWVLERALSHDHWRAVWQVCLALVVGSYFVSQWTRGGQTLPMKTWRLRLIARDGSAVDVRTAVLRYVLAAAGSIAVGAGFAWAFIDKDRQFLHDRVLGTRIVRV